MVKLTKIYTRGGDGGKTSLGDGTRLPKYDTRVETYGTVDEANAVIGVVRLHTKDDRHADDMLARIQNDLFDVGADLCRPGEVPIEDAQLYEDPSPDAIGEATDRGAAKAAEQALGLVADKATTRAYDEDLRITATQVRRLETEIDAMTADLEPLSSFVLPGGSPAGAHLHLARTVVRRAERLLCTLDEYEYVNPEVVRYMNRLSDHLFQLARRMNGQGADDVLWTPGENT